MFLFRLLVLFGLSDAFSTLSVKMIRRFWIVILDGLDSSKNYEWLNFINKKGLIELLGSSKYKVCYCRKILGAETLCFFVFFFAFSICAKVYSSQIQVVDQ